MKIQHSVSEGAKRYGVMPAIVDDCKSELVKTAPGKADYSQITLFVSVDNGTDKPISKRIFFKLPFDSYKKPGEPENLFHKFRKVTGLSAEELGDTENYKKKGFYVIVGPSKTWDGKLKTYLHKDTDKVMLSYDITDILEGGEKDFDKEALEKELAEYVEECQKEIDPSAQPATAKDLGFEEEKKGEMPTF